MVMRRVRVGSAGAFGTIGGIADFGMATSLAGFIGRDATFLPHFVSTSVARAKDVPHAFSPPPATQFTAQVLVLTCFCLLMAGVKTGDNLGDAPVTFSDVTYNLARPFVV